MRKSYIHSHRLKKTDLPGSMLYVKILVPADQVVAYTSACNALNEAAELTLNRISEIVTSNGARIHISIYQEDAFPEDGDTTETILEKVGSSQSVNSKSNNNDFDDLFNSFFLSNFLSKFLLRLTETPMFDDTTLYKKMADLSSIVDKFTFTTEDGYEYLIAGTESISQQAATIPEPHRQKYLWLNAFIDRARDFSFTTSSPTLETLTKYAPGVVDVLNSLDSALLSFRNSFCPTGESTEAREQALLLIWKCAKNARAYTENYGASPETLAVYKEMKRSLLRCKRVMSKPEPLSSDEHDPYSRLIQAVTVYKEAIIADIIRARLRQQLAQLPGQSRWLTPAPQRPTSAL